MLSDMLEYAYDDSKQPTHSAVRFQPQTVCSLVIYLLIAVSPLARNSPSLFLLFPAESQTHRVEKMWRYQNSPPSNSRIPVEFSSHSWQVEFCKTDRELTRVNSPGWRIWRNRFLYSQFPRGYGVKRSQFLNYDNAKHRRTGKFCHIFVILWNDRSAFCYTQSCIYEKQEGKKEKEKRYTRVIRDTSAACREIYFPFRGHLMLHDATPAGGPI